MKYYDLTIYYIGDPDDALGYDTIIEAEDLEAAKQCVKNMDNYAEFSNYVISGFGEYYSYEEEEEQGLEPEEER